MTVQDVTVHFRQFASRDHLTGRRAYLIFSHCKFRETYQTNHRNVRDCFYRYLLCLPLLIMYGRWTLGAHFLQISNVPILILQSVFSFLVLSFWFFATAYIDISLAKALANTMPIFITILSSLIGKETVGLQRIIAVLCGFCGVLD